MMARRISPARRRYFVRLVGFMALYMALLIPIAWSQPRGYWPDGPLRYALAVLPAIPVMGVIWTILRYVVEEEDEYQRHLHVQAALVATGVTLSIATAWSFLARYAGVPAQNGMYVFVIFCAVLFLGLGVTSWRQR